MMVVNDCNEQVTGRPGGEGADLVLGLGHTGLACARFLSKAGRRVLVMDSRAAPPALARLRAELPGIEVITGGFDERIARRAARIIVSPGVSLQEPAVRAAVLDGVEVLGEIELFARAVNAPVAAITGSNGKSTVTAMLGVVLNAAGLDVAVGGNLGTNALELLRTPAPDAYVLELSSFQLESTWSLRPRVACVLNVCADHMDRYPDLDSYAAAKARVFEGARAAVVNLDDPRVPPMAAGRESVLGFTLAGAPGAFAVVRGEGPDSVLELGGQALMQAREVPLAGRHNLANVLAACCMASVLGAGREAMAGAVRGFRGLRHRCELLGEHAGVRFVNDSKGTNVGATLAAIQGLQEGRNLVLIAGGEGKRQDFSPLAAAISAHVHTLVLFGRDALAIDAAVPSRVRRVHASDLAQALTRARDAARPGDCVLFSPACASFDMFESYEARGDAFAALVRSVIGP